MINKKKNIYKFILYYLSLYQIFFFHIFNIFNVKYNILIVSISATLALFIFFKNLKHLVLNIDLETKLILLLITVFIIIKFFLLLKAFLTFPTDVLEIMSKSTYNFFIFVDVIYLISIIYFFIIFKTFKINFIKLFLISFFIAIFLLTFSAINIMISNPISHVGWFNPYIYLFFFNDNVSSKLQHGYIFLIITLPLIHELYQTKKIVFKIVFVLFVFYLFFIFSKLFFIIFILFLLIYNLFYYSKENIFLTVKLLLISIAMIFTLLFFINNFSDRKTNVSEQIVLKFASIIKFTNFKINLKNYLKDTNFENYNNNQIINYFDSTQNRYDRFLFCSKKGLKYKSFKHFNVIKVPSSYKSGNLNENFLLNITGPKKYHILNCEGSLIEIYYKYEYISIFAYLGFGLILLYFFKKRDKFTIICILIITLISFQHLTLENPITYFFLVYLLFAANQKKLKNLT